MVKPPVRRNLDLNTHNHRELEALLFPAWFLTSIQVQDVVDTIAVHGSVSKPDHMGQECSIAVHRGDFFEKSGDSELVSGTEFQSLDTLLIAVFSHLHSREGGDEIPRDRDQTLEEIYADDSVFYQHQRTLSMAAEVGHDAASALVVDCVYDSHGSRGVIADRVRDRFNLEDKPDFDGIFDALLDSGVLRERSDGTLGVGDEGRVVYELLDALLGHR